MRPKVPLEKSQGSGSKKSPDVGISTPPTSQTSKTNQTNVPSASSRTPIPRTNPNKMECLYQYAVEHSLDPEKFSIVTEADKTRWAGESFRGIFFTETREIGAL